MAQKVIQKTIRVSAQVNGRKALDSKPCEHLYEAYNNLTEKLAKYRNKHEITHVRFGANKLSDNNEYVIDNELSDQLEELVNKTFNRSDWPGIYFFSVSRHGLP